MKLIVALGVLLFAGVAKAECKYDIEVFFVRETPENYAVLEDVEDALQEWGEKSWCASLAASAHRVAVSVEVVTPTSFRVEARYFGFLSDPKKDRARVKLVRKAASIEAMLEFLTSTIPEEK